MGHKAQCTFLNKQIHDNNALYYDCTRLLYSLCDDTHMAR